MSFYPDFSVLISVYSNDDPVMFDAALSSIFDNSLVPSQVVLAVDGPICNSLDAVIDRFSSKSTMQVVRLPENVGLAVALNEGLRYVTNRWTFRCDSDDVNLPDRFLTQLKYVMANPGCVLLGGYILEVDREGVEIARRTVPLGDACIKKSISRRNPFNHMTILFDSVVVKQLGGYPLLSLREDYALWIIFVSSGYSVANVSDVLVRATAGVDMYKRRGGLRYALGEIDLQRLLVASRLKRPSIAVLDGLMRSFVFLAPASLRGFIYRYLLRSRVQ